MFVPKTNIEYQVPTAFPTLNKVASLLASIVAKLFHQKKREQAGAELCQDQVSYAVEFDGLDKLYNLN